MLGVEGLDTRALTRHIRDAGAMRAVLSTEDLEPGSLVQRARAVPGMVGQDLASIVIDRAPPIVGKAGRRSDRGNAARQTVMWTRRRAESVRGRHRLRHQIQHLEMSRQSAGFEIVVVPEDTRPRRSSASTRTASSYPTAPEIRSQSTYAVETIRYLLGYRPDFRNLSGTSASGTRPGRSDLQAQIRPPRRQPAGKESDDRQEWKSPPRTTGLRWISTALEENDIEMTHINLNDNTLEGFRHRKLPLFAVQYHPEASPGPHDANICLIDSEMMDNVLNWCLELFRRMSRQRP